MKILDCTFRDGGYYTDWDFDQKLVKDFLNYLENEVRQIDILVNNAGINIVNKITDVDKDEFKSVIDVNLVGPAILTSSISKKND